MSLVDMMVIDIGQGVCTMGTGRLAPLIGILVPMIILRACQGYCPANLLACFAA